MSRVTSRRDAGCTVAAIGALVAVTIWGAFAATKRLLLEVSPATVLLTVLAAVLVTGGLAVRGVCMRSGRATGLGSWSSPSSGWR